MIQRSFASGEVAPALYGRADVDRWRTALEQCRNWITKAEGGLSVRQGFEYVGAVTCNDTSPYIRLLPFEYSPSDSVVITLSYDGVSAYSYKFFRNGLQLFSGGSTPLELAASYEHTDDIRSVQSGNVLFCAGGDNRPISITRVNGNSYTWTQTATPLTPSSFAVTALSLSGTAGTDQLRYMVTASDRDEIESAVCRKASGSVSFTNTATYVVGHTAHGLETNDTIEIKTPIFDTGGAVVYRDGDKLRVIRIDANSFSLPVHSVAANGSPFSYNKFTASSVSLAQPTSTAAVTVSWTPSVAGAVYYNVYREYGRVFGYIGSTVSTTFVDKGIIPDTKDTPVFGTTPIRPTEGTAENFPKAVGIFQQRLVYGGFAQDVERVASSHTGNYQAFDPGAEDTSGLDFTLAGRTVSDVQHLLEIAGRAVVLSSTSEWVLRGGSNGLTPTAINARVDSYNGVSEVQPVVVGNSLLYVQRGNKIVRDCKYDYAQEALNSRDLTLWAKHLFIPGIRRVVYQRSEQIVWALCDDGILLGLTYGPDQDVWGWHRHDVDGFAIQDICCVSEDGQDRLYAAIKTYRADTGHDALIGRLPLPWDKGTEDDHKGFDFYTAWDGRLKATDGTTPVATSAYCVLTGGTLWTTAETLTLTASAALFKSASAVGSYYLLRVGAQSVYVRITARATDYAVSVVPLTIVPAEIRGVNVTDYALCASTLAVPTYFRGKTFGVIADRGQQPDVVIDASDTISFDHPFGRIQAGLKVTALSRTLPLEEEDSASTLGEYKSVKRVSVLVDKTRGLELGEQTDKMYPIKPRYAAVPGQAPTLLSGDFEVSAKADYTATGQIYMRQTTGLPATILNIKPFFTRGRES